MTIGAILHGRTGPVILARKEDTVRAVLDLLAQHRIGAVPVMEGDAIVGIFSERDLVRLMSSYGPEALDRQRNGRARHPGLHARHVRCAALLGGGLERRPRRQEAAPAGSHRRSDGPGVPRRGQVTGK